MAERVEERIYGGGRLAEHGRQHGQQRRQEAPVAGDAGQSDDGVRCPGQEPNGDHEDDENRQAELALALLAFLADPRQAGVEHVAADFVVARRYYGKRDAPGAEKENQYENPIGQTVADVVETAARKVTFGHVRFDAETAARERESGEEGGVKPDQRDGQCRPAVRQFVLRVERVDYDGAAVASDEREGRAGRYAGEAADYAVKLAACAKTTENENTYFEIVKNSKSN